jgi:hypothetical protein
VVLRRGPKRRHDGGQLNQAKVKGATNALMTARDIIVEQSKTRNEHGSGTQIACLSVVMLSVYIILPSKLVLILSEIIFLFYHDRISSSIPFGEHM